MIDLSIVIPSLREPYLLKTVEDIRAKATGSIEILVGDDEVEKLGQRALTNKLVRQAQGKYIMKTDAHCLFSKGFDKDMLKVADDKTIVAPYLLRLDAENWKPIPKPCVSSYVFDTNLVMQYGEESTQLVAETMCLQGSCFLVDRQTYWDWNLGDESLGSWGGQGPELGIKAWHNGGRCITTKECYYAHLFREKEEDFPYQRDKAQIKSTTQEVVHRFKDNRIAGLIKKFNYPADWSPELTDALPSVV
jgi:glycosyltransferase involved in cell wall biosynthesis